MNLSKYPLYLVLMVQTGLAMFIPAGYAFAIQQASEARSYLYAGILLLLLSAFISIAVRKQQKREISQKTQLLLLLTALVGLPFFMAVPFHDTMKNVGFLQAYFEMVSSFTTTGASLFSHPLDYTMTQHLWRAEVAWFGGYVILVAAAAILAPMHLGGYEVIDASGDPRDHGRLTEVVVREGAVTRIARWSQRIFPVYTAVTVLLWVGLYATGQPVDVALIHAMSVLSTSGISPVGGFDALPFNFWAEALVFLFMLAALSRLTLLPDVPGGRGLWKDPEMRFGLMIIVTVPLVLVVRHWVASIDYGNDETLYTLLHALWGGLFTVASFLTTTGFVSAEWQEVAFWSGLGSPELVLAGLAIIGGGVATTAGGVKLLRMFALYSQGKKELGMMVFPSSVGQEGTKAYRITKAGMQIAWVFFTLYAITIAIGMGILTFQGLSFDHAVIVTVAALSNTGPLAEASLGHGFAYGDLGGWVQGTLIALMIIGRLELLALVALFNGDFWRA